MENKVLVYVSFPKIEQTFTLFLPINKKIGNIVLLVNKAVKEIVNNDKIINDDCSVYNEKTKETYNPDIMLHKTNIRNGSRLIFL